MTVGKWRARFVARRLDGLLDEPRSGAPRRVSDAAIERGTHKTALIRRWLAKRPRFHLHFTPTSPSWPNLVERWFAALSEKWLRSCA